MEWIRVSSSLKTITTLSQRARSARLLSVIFVITTPQFFYMKKLNTYFSPLAALIAILSSLLFVWYQSNQVERNELSGDVNDRTTVSITTLSDQLEKDPENLKLAIALSDSYLQKIRETGDATLYLKIEEVLDRVGSDKDVRGEVLAKRAEIANGRHDFVQGLAYILEALALNPQSASYYGIKTDSEIELGKYDDAERSLQKMVDIKPNFSSFSRVAYQRQLRGDREGALEALAAAISAGSIFPENIAWALTESGKLHMSSDVAMAKRDFTKAIDIYPTYAPAYEGLGRVAFIEGDKEASLANYLRAFEILPVATNAIALGNFYEVAGDEVKAKQYYALAELAYLDSKGTNVDLEYALFLADHSDVVKALTLAQAVYETRQSIYTADAYAWALYKNNQSAKAEQYSNEALFLGGHDTGILYHAAMITNANGNAEASTTHVKRALELDESASLLYSQALTDKPI